MMAIHKELSYLKAAYESITDGSPWGLTFGCPIHKDVEAYLQQALDHARAIISRPADKGASNTTVPFLIQEFGQMKRAVHLASIDASLLRDGGLDLNHYLGVYLPVAFCLVFQGGNLLRRELILRSKAKSRRGKPKEE